MIVPSPHPSVAIPGVSLGEFLFRDLDSRRDRAALIDGASGRTLTYGELHDHSVAVARALIARGLEPGDVVAIASPNLPEYAVAFHAVAMAGGCNTTLNPLQTVPEIVHQLADSGARWILTVPPLLEKAREVAAQTRVEEIFVFGEGEGATPFQTLVEEGLAAGASIGAEVGPAGVIPGRVGDPAGHLVALPYSSGTTGRPKGVMLTHRNLVANLAQCHAVDPVEPDEIIIAVLPFFHIYGMVVIMGCGLRAGATVVTLPRFDLEVFLETVERHGVTRAYLVPPIVLALAKHPAVDSYDLSSVRYVMSGAAPLGAEVALACQTRLGCDVTQGYGLTETSPVTHYRPWRWGGDERIASVGPSVPGTEVLIADLETGEPLPRGETGEVWIRGPQVMAGYLNRPDATGRTIDEDGWLHTGDVGRVDEDGALTIVDRAKELIKYKGFQVPPAELEDVLLSHPSVRDAAVIPIPDEEAGEVPKAFVVRSGDVSAEALGAYVAERVSPYKKIRCFEFVDQIPKSPSGKILRRILVDREREAAAAAGA